MASAAIAAPVKFEVSEQEEVLDLSIPSTKHRRTTSSVDQPSHQEKLAHNSDDGKNKASVKKACKSCCKCNDQCSNKDNTKEVERTVVQRFPFPVFCYPAWPISGLSPLNFLPPLQNMRGIERMPFPFYTADTCTPVSTSLKNDSEKVVSPPVHQKTKFATKKNEEKGATQEKPPLVPVLRHKRASRPVPSSRLPATPASRDPAADNVAPEEDTEEDLLSEARKQRQRSLEQRREANARERQRVQMLLHAFNELRLVLPTLNGTITSSNFLTARPSKMWILRTASAYIAALSALLERDISRPETVTRFDNASSWLRSLLQQSGRVPSASLLGRSSNDLDLDSS